MGKSDDISEQEKRNKKFDDFMANRKKQGDAELMEIHGKVTADKDAYYKENKFDDASQYMANRFQEFQSSKSWSLDNITKITENVASVLIGGKDPSKSTKETPKDVLETVGKSALALAANQQYIVSTVFQALTGVIDTFSVTSKSQQQQSIRNFPVMGGMHLFLGMSSETYESNDFFEKVYINQLGISFMAYFSPKEAIRQGQIDSVKMYLDRLTSLALTMAKINKSLEELDPMSDSATKVFNAYKTFDQMWQNTNVALKAIQTNRASNLKILHRNAFNQSELVDLQHTVGNWPVLQQKIEQC